MYTPPSFVESDPKNLHDFIRENSFATLISTAGDFPTATHVPLLLYADPGRHGTLLGHMARANQQWKSMDGADVLAIFHGPHAYISSSWYETNKAVPTWNYIVVHAHGECQITDDAESNRQTVERYMERFEPTYQADEEYVTDILPATVSFRIPISRLEGTWKLSQNHSRERRRSVVQHLRTVGDAGSVEIAELMSKSLDSDPDM